MEFTKTMVTFFFIMATLASSMADVHDVGGSDGWASNVDYEKWSSKKKFAVGDSLVFSSNGKKDGVLLVSKEEFKSCEPKSPIASHNSGKDSINLSAEGEYYFISAVPTNCQAGKKLKIVVTSS